MKGDHLFIAVPELRFNLKLLDEMRKRKMISSETYDSIRENQKRFKKADKIAAAAMKGDTLIARVLAVAPEILSVESVNLFRSASLLSESQGHALRIAIRTLNAATRGGLPTDAGQIFSRLSRVAGAQVSFERIDLWRSMGLITASDAERWRNYLRTGFVVRESVVKVKRAKSLVDALLVLGEISVDDKMISLLVASGIINARLGRVYKSVIRLGVKEWKVFSGARAAEGWRRRALLMLTGSMNAELMDFMLINRVITRAQWSGLQIAEIISRQVNDRLLDDLTKRRYRIRPGEAPIRSFARATRTDDREILRLLALAAQESSKEAAQLAAIGKRGAAIRSAQYRLAAAGLHQAMRNMWDGVGYLTIWGERNAAEVAAESAEMLQKKVLTGLPPDLRRSLFWQSKAGVDSYISRQENTLRLSRLVYKNMALYQGKVDQRISLSLLRGQGAEEISTMVLKFISPNVPGGASYAAMRLARTEINNSFHFSTIRYTRELPWIQAYKWHKSNSHKTPDQCDAYAEDDHDNLGPGVFKKANVPGKPHPQCLCYITAEVMDNARFLSAYRAGRFDSYLRQVQQGEAFTNYDSGSFSTYAKTNLGNAVAGVSL